MSKSFKRHRIINKGRIKVSNLHSIYFEESGNPKGIPVVSIHGGPGSQSKPHHKSYFNPDKYRLIVFDQRGAGKSLPAGELRDNTTTDILHDIESLRKHFQIEKWMVFGASWGSTLALLYAEKYPRSVSHIFVRSIFLARPVDVDWILRGHALKNIFPELWKQREAVFDRLHISRGKHFYKQILATLRTGTDIQKRLAVLTFENWEGQFFSIDQKINLKKPQQLRQRDILDATLFMHYAVNNFWISNNHILNNVARLPKVPIVILHGQYDVDCPLIQAWSLSRSLDKRNHVFEVIPAAGHHLSSFGWERTRYYTEKLAKKVKT